MANDLNLCQFIGRLGKDPETRYLPNGDATTSFSIAVGSSWTDKQSGDKKETTEWVRCVAWRKLAEIISEYCRKGQQVYVSGQFKTRKWQDKEGVDRYMTEITIDRMQMLGSKGDNNSPQEQAAPAAAPAKKGKGKAAPKQPSLEDDDIPF